MSQTEHAQIAAVTSTLPATATEAGATRFHGNVAAGQRGALLWSHSAHKLKPLLSQGAPWGRWVDEHKLQSPKLPLGCNGVSVGVPLSPILLCKYIPAQWTSECSDPIAAAAELSMRANITLSGFYLSWKYIHYEHLGLGFSQFGLYFAFVIS